MSKLQEKMEKKRQRKLEKKLRKQQKDSVESPKTAEASAEEPPQKIKTNKVSLLYNITRKRLRNLFIFSENEADSAPGRNGSPSNEAEET